MIICTNTDTMEAISNRIISNAEEYLAQYLFLRDSLETYSSWIGKDSDSYRQKAATLCKNLEKMIDSLKQANNHLEFFSVLYKQTAKAACDRAKLI